MQLDDFLSGRRAKFISLGCKLNFAENSAVADQLSKYGIIRASSKEVADICIINTCTVTETANRKCRQAIHKAMRENPGAYIVVMGCYAQTHSQAIASMEGVDLVVGMEQKGNLPQLLADNLPLLSENKKSMEAVTCYTERKDIVSFVPSCSHGTRTRYFLKVQDGCDYFCTYCAIPFARGKSRNGSISSLIEQAESVAAQGGKEIVITGVNIGDFGKTTGESFYDLLKGLDQVEGIERYRISSIEPNLLTPEIIRFCSESKKFMPHFHIPLQSGSDEVLKLMHRRYDTAFFKQRIDAILEVIPDAFIGVDIMVGCRGESEECFNEAWAFAQSLRVAQFHVFTYSERPGTAALKIPLVVDEEEKHRRSQLLLDLSEEKRKAFYQANIGKIRKVLTEHGKAGQPVKGFTDNYIKVELPELKGRNFQDDNKLIEVELISFNADQSALLGKLI